jgi:SAM-dependent methyltransferase
MTSACDSFDQVANSSNPNVVASSDSPPRSATCRSCGARLRHVFADLGMSPLANNYLSQSQLDRMEPFFPLKVYVCDTCLLVQAQQFESPESIFGDYAYFSSYSDSWLEHARYYCQKMLTRFQLGGNSRVMEIASNDGYLLQYFVQAGIPVLGIEPARNVAQAAQQRGIPTLVRFFGSDLADELLRNGQTADLIIGNNVLAHVPQLNDFVCGIKHVLNPLGVVTMEFPHLLRLIAETQFDTIYHEHFSYFSYLAVRQVFARQGLTIFDVDELPTHGGSLRIYVRHSSDQSKPITSAVEQLERKEKEASLDCLATYSSFADEITRVKRGLLTFLIEARNAGKDVVGYGAPAKGNTLLSYCGIRTDLLEYTVDRSPHKYGRYLPGTHIPIYHPDKLKETKPDYIIVLPWNLLDEIMSSMSHVRAWGARFVVPIPEVKIY